MPDLPGQVRAALGAAYDPKATYLVVRPAMVGLPKYAGDAVVGEFVEDTRNETRMIVLLRKAPVAKPLPVPVSAPPTAPSVAAAAADRVRRLFGRVRGTRG